MSELKELQDLVARLERRLEAIEARYKIPDKWDYKQEQVLVQVVSLPHVVTLEQARDTYNTYASKFRLPKRSEGAIRARLDKLGISLKKLD